MLDGDIVESIRAAIMDRYTADELVEILGLTTEQIFDAFDSLCLEQDWTELL